jgi:DnaJ-class molecular chaperone
MSEKACGTCNGSGRINCPACDGTTQNHLNDKATNKWQPCARCKGSGEITCPKCRGSGD